jgi:hypothetical protein
MVLSCNWSRQACRKGAEESERQLQFGFHCEEPQKEDFMRRVVIGALSLVVLSLFLNATGAYAQSVVKVNVPFAFRVGGAQMPAGCYTITPTYLRNAILIRNCKTSAAVLSVAQQEYPRDTSSRVEFQHLGDQYFLAEVWGDAGSRGMTIPAPKPERKLQVASGSSTARKPVVIALH